MKILLSLIVLVGSAMAQLANTIPAVPTSAESTLQACDASGNCTAPVLQPRTFPGTIMDTSFPVQTGTVFSVANASQLTSALSSAACGDTINITATITGTSSDNTHPAFTLPTNKVANGKKWILIQTSHISSLHPFGNRVFASAAEIATYEPFLAQITATGGAGVIFNYPDVSNGTNGCGYYLAGIEMYPSSNLPIVYANNVAPNGFQTFELNDIHGDHFVCNRCYVHGIDDLAFPATACSSASNVATITSNNYSQVNDTVNITGFTGACAYLNGSHIVNAVGTFASATITSIQKGFGTGHKFDQATTIGTAPFAFNDIVLVGQQPNTICGNGCLIGDTGFATVTAVSGNTFIYGPIGNSICSSSCPIVSVSNMYARKLATTFTVTSFHADFSTTSDTGFAQNNQAPNQLGTGLRQDMTKPFSMYGAQFAAITDSWISNVHSFVEGQCVLTYNVQPGHGSNGPYKFNNNYLDCMGEHIFSGGAAQTFTGDPAPGIVLSTTIPHDFEVRNNYFAFPDTVAYMAANNNTRLGYSVWVPKSDFELKSGIRILLTGNVMQSPWAWGGSGDNGSSLRFSLVPNQSGIDATISDVFLVNNFMYNGNQTFNMSTVGPTVCSYNQNVFNSPNYCQIQGDLQRITIQNNFMGLRPMAQTTVIGAGTTSLDLGYGLGAGSHNISSIHNTIWYAGGVQLPSLNQFNWVSINNGTHIQTSVEFADVLTAPNNPVCRGANWAINDIFAIPACTGVLQQVKTIGAGGCVQTAVTASTSTNLLTCGTSQLNVSTDHVSTGTLCTSGTCVDFNVNVRLTAPEDNYWETDNVGFSVTGASAGGGYAQAMWDTWMSTPSTSPNDIAHRHQNNYYNVYPPKLITQTPYHPNFDCGTVTGGVSVPSTINPTFIPMSNCEAAAPSSTVPNGGFAFVTPINITGNYSPGADYSLVNPYKANQATAVAGVDFNSNTGLNHAIATTITGQINGNLSVLTTILPIATINVPYTAMIQAVGGTPPYSCSVNSGALPPGLTLMGCVITGTPTTLGMSTFVIKVTDSVLNTALSQPLTIQVIPIGTVALTATAYLLML